MRQLSEMMARHKKFQAILIALVISILGFNLIDIGSEFFLNPFYILSFVIAFLLIIKSINYTCPNCRKNQVIRSFLSYRMPKTNCYSCGTKLDNNED